MSNNVAISLFFSVRFMTCLRHYICSIPVISFIILSLKDKPCCILLIIIKRGILFYVIEDIIVGFRIESSLSTCRIRMGFICNTCLIERFISCICPILIRTLRVFKSCLTLILRCWIYNIISTILFSSYSSKPKYIKLANVLSAAVRLKTYSCEVNTL